MRKYSDLHEYQQRAIDYLFEHDSALALLPVGAGKSAIGWTTAVELMDAGYVKCPIVFAPLRVAQITWPAERDEWEHLADRKLIEWGGEPAGWAPSLWRDSRLLWGSRNALESRLPKIVDTIRKREIEDRINALITEERRVNKALRKAVPEKALHVTSYENLSWFCDLYTPGETPFDHMIFDEIGRLKNPKSPRYKAIRKQTRETPIVHGMNATPAPEGFEDLFAQVQIVDGGKLWGKSFYGWRQKYFAPIDYHGYAWRLQLGAKDILMRDLNTIAFKVDEADLSYTKSMQHSQIRVDMPAKARELYREMEKVMAVTLEGNNLDADELDIVALSAASASMKLRQITSGFIYDEEGQVHRLHDEKQNALADLIDSMGREPLLVAYEFTEDLDAIRRIWKKLPYLGAGVTAVEARDNIERWNKRELPVMALHWASAGHGLNLQKGGSHVAWYNLPWTLEGYQQLNGRVDRQGQTRACFGHHIIVTDSMDQRVSDALLMKDADQAAVIAAIRTI